MKVTLKDIAEETGYSISTVSRVLNGSDKIGKQARREIYRTAKKLNYPIYRTLDGKEIIDTLKILFIVTGFHQGAFYSSLFYGMNRAAEKYNVQISFVFLNKPFNKILKTIRNIEDDKFEGLVLFAPEFNKNHYQRIKEELPDKFPIISNGLIENPVVSTVTFDGYSGGFLAGEHFNKKGYEKCGIIRGPLEKTEARYRFNGFRDYITQDKEMELVWNFDGDFTFESGVEAFKKFEKEDLKPRAIFASNDDMGHAFLEEALARGYQVPDELALVSFDDLPICRRHRPTISSVHTDYEKLGLVTVEKMKELLDNPDQQEGVLSLVPVHLNIRESS